MPLNGLNKLCYECSKNCKQFKQITVIHCPNYAKHQKVHLDHKEENRLVGDNLNEKNELGVV